MTTNWESNQIYSHLMPMFLASESLVISASYSASLLVTQKPHQIDCWIKSPLGEVMIRPMPEPFRLLEPSTKSVHLDVECSVKLSNSSSYTSVLGVKSVMKSTNTCDLSAMQG